jgi:hypothetical protein
MADERAENIECVPTSMLQLLLILLLSPARAEEPVAEGTHKETPTTISWILSPTKNGMLVKVPVFDTDPNSGPTFGFMPVWVVVSSSTIRHIHAPAVTVNHNFGATLSYQYPRSTGKCNTLTEGFRRSLESQALPG